MRLLPLLFLLPSLQLPTAAHKPHHVPPTALPFSPSIDPSSLPNSYAGFIPVRGGVGELFYWFFPHVDKEKPLMIWLQGGPGGSSMLGLLLLMGPLRVSSATTLDGLTNYTLTLNPNTYASDFSMLFIDNPVGTGFSYVNQTASALKYGYGYRSRDIGEDGQLSEAHTKFWDEGLGAGYTPTVRKESEWESFFGSLREEGDGLKFQSEDSSMQWNEGQFEVEKEGWSHGYTTNQLAVSKDLAEFIHGFYALYPHMKEVDLHVASESYGGKYIPQLAQHFRTHHPDIPLKTVAIGNGWTDPFPQIATHPMHYMAIGLIDEVQAGIVGETIALAQEHTVAEEWMKGLEKREEMWEQLKNFTGDVDMYDVRLGSVHPDHTTYSDFLNLKSTKRALHVPEWMSFGKDENVFYHLREDIMKSEKGNVEEVLEEGGVPLLLYQGNWDLRDGVISNSAWIKETNWSGAAAFNAAPRKVWKNDEGELRGYIQQHGPLTRAVLFGCGHMAPADDGCPETAKEMMLRHTRGGAFMEH
ncbi:alpha/beta-hydrolase [Atractiella rhizophila]|nr:alpha/beta-hydrolase [Atractiella rhizophila]